MIGTAGHGHLGMGAVLEFPRTIQAALLTRITIYEPVGSARLDAFP